MEGKGREGEGGGGGGGGEEEAGESGWGYEDDGYDHDGEGWAPPDKEEVSKKSEEARKLMEEMATMGYDDVQAGTKFK